MCLFGSLQWQTTESQGRDPVRRHQLSLFRGAGVPGSNVRGVTVSSHDFKHLQPQSVILGVTSLPSPGFYDSREACSFEEKSHHCSTGHVTAFLPYLPALPRLTSQEPGAMQGFLSTTWNNFLKIGSDIPQIRRHYQGQPLLKYRCSRSLHLDYVVCVEGTENLPCCYVRGQVMSPCGHTQGWRAWEPPGLWETVPRKKGGVRPHRARGCAAGRLMRPRWGSWGDRSGEMQERNAIISFWNVFLLPQHLGPVSLLPSQMISN